MHVIEHLNRIIAERGYMVDSHRHLASEHTITPALYAKIADGRPLNEKWSLMDQIRRDPVYLDNLPVRLNWAISRMYKQRIRFCRTYAEIDASVELHVVDAMLDAKERWASEGFVLQIAAYPFQGIGDKTKLKRAEQALERADLLGCLPSRGRRDAYDLGTTRANMHALFSLAQEQEKPIDLQIDQDNHPSERESWALVEVAEKFRDSGYTLSITATHCISLSARPPDYRASVIKRMRELDISVVTCPSAALGMKQPNQHASTHNSIAPVTELLEAGVTVGIGSDNVSDLYEPFTTGDLRAEMGKMLSAIRWTGSLETIADIMTTNGRKILGV